MKVLLDRKYEYIMSELSDVENAIIFEPEDSVEVIVGDTRFVNEHYKLPNVKYIQISSSGYNNLDLAYFKAHGIQLMNARGLYSIPIAEYVLSYILSITKKHRMFDISQVKHEWNPDRSLKSIEESSALLLGTGDIAKEVVKRLKAFGVTVTGLNSDGRLIEGFDRCDTLTNFEKYIGDVEFVIAALPENEYTTRIINKEHFKMMKPNSIFINVGRGSLIDGRGVHTAIGHLAGLVLDVFEEEPMPSGHPLWDLANVFITGHASSGSQHNNKRTTQLFTENIKAILRGEVPKNCINI